LAAKHASVEVEWLRFFDRDRLYGRVCRVQHHIPRYAQCGRWHFDRQRTFLANPSIADRAQGCEIVTPPWRGQCVGLELQGRLAGGQRSGHRCQVIGLEIGFQVHEKLDRRQGSGPSTTWILSLSAGAACKGACPAAALVIR
jgi:hypothetical protein